MSEFFQGIRPQVYFDGGRFYLDKKTQKRMWAIKLAIDLDADLIAKCDGPVLTNYIAIETAENHAEEIVMSCAIPSQDIDFYPLATGNESLLWLRAEIEELRITREEGLTTLHFKLDVPYQPIVHRFIGEYSFAKLWIEFKPSQFTLAGASKPAQPREIRPN